MFHLGPLLSAVSPVTNRLQKSSAVLRLGSLFLLPVVLCFKTEQTNPLELFVVMESITCLYSWKSHPHNLQRLSFNDFRARMEAGLQKSYLLPGS